MDLGAGVASGRARGFHKKCEQDRVRREEGLLWFWKSIVGLQGGCLLGNLGAVMASDGAGGFHWRCRG